MNFWRLAEIVNSRTQRAQPRAVSMGSMAHATNRLPGVGIGQPRRCWDMGNPRRPLMQVPAGRQVIPRAETLHQLTPEPGA